MVELIAKVKSNAFMAILEAKIKFAEDVANAGSQNLVGWHIALSKLKGEHVNTSEDPEWQQEKANEEEKTTSNDDQFTVQACQTKIFNMILYKIIFIIHGINVKLILLSMVFYTPMFAWLICVVATIGFLGILL